MLAIRLARTGARKKPSYRVVVMEKSRPRDSRSVEIVGHYNPTKDPIILHLDEQRIQYWLSKGAQPSDTVRRLMTYQAQSPEARKAKAEAKEEQRQKAEEAEAASAASSEATPEPEKEEPAPASSEQAPASSSEPEPASEEGKPSAE